MSGQEMKPNQDGARTNGARRSTGERLWNLIGSHGPVVRLSVIAVVIFAIMAALRPSLFLTESNFLSMAFQIPEFAILSLAMMLSMLTAGIDLSIIGIMNLSAILGGLYLSNAGASAGSGVIAVTILIVLVTGVLCGLLNGLLISRVGIPPILATLGTSQVFLGLGIVVTKGAAVYGFPDAFSRIGNGRLLGLPVPLIILLIAAGVVAFLLRRTRFGAEVYMLGTNPLAARFSGIDSVRLIFGTYALSGLLSAVAGVVVMSRVNSIRADFGASYLLLTILVAVLGGVNPYGGFGKVIGVLLAVVSLQLLSSGFNMMRFSNFAREFIWGALLLLVMVLGSGPFTNAVQRFKRSRSRPGHPLAEPEESS